MAFFGGMENFPHNAINAVPDHGICLTWLNMNVTCPELDSIGNNMVGKFYYRCLFRQNNQVLDIIFFIRGFFIRNNLQKGINIRVFCQLRVKIVCIILLQSSSYFTFR